MVFWGGAPEKMYDKGGGTQKMKDQERGAIQKTKESWGIFLYYLKKMVYTSVCVRGRGRGQGGQAFLDTMSFFTLNEPIFQFFFSSFPPLCWRLLPHPPASHLGHVTATLVDEREAVMD